MPASRISAYTIYCDAGHIRKRYHGSHHALLVDALFAIEEAIAASSFGSGRATPEDHQRFSFRLVERLRSR